METQIQGVQMVPPQILISQLQERIKHLEDGHKRIIQVCNLVKGELYG